MAQGEGIILVVYGEVVGTCYDEDNGEGSWEALPEEERAKKVAAAEHALLSSEVLWDVIVEMVRNA